MATLTLCLNVVRTFGARVDSLSESPSQIEYE